MAFPYIAMSDDDKLEKSLLSGFAENCNNGLGNNHITYTDTCSVSEDLKKHHDMDSIHVSFYSSFGTSCNFSFPFIDHMYIPGIGGITN